jgi:hypothetical protein
MKEWHFVGYCVLFLGVSSFLFSQRPMNGGLTEWAAEEIAYRKEVREVTGESK